MIMDYFSCSYRLDDEMTDVTEAKNVFRLLSNLYEHGLLSKKPLDVELRTVASKIENAKPQRCLDVEFT